MKKEMKANQYTEMRRPTVALTEEEHKEIGIYCIANGYKMGEFLKEAALYLIRNKITLRTKK